MLWKSYSVDYEWDFEEKTENFHSSITNHRQQDETEQKIKSLCYWANVSQSVQNFTNNSEICLIILYDKKPLKIELNIMPTAVKPFFI